MEPTLQPAEAEMYSNAQQADDAALQEMINANAEPAQENPEQQTIPGVRVMFNNGQTFDLPTISKLDEEPPTYEQVMTRFRDQKWIKLGGSNITINTESVSAVSEIRIKVVEQAPENVPEIPQ